MTEPETGRRDLRSPVAEMLRAAWRQPGFCVPNPSTYPFQWLWDSCFHAVIWAELGDERAVIELDNLFAHQHRSGFVPHMTYWSDPEHAAGFWGRSMTSVLTQPPMFGHAIAAIVERGLDPPDDLVARAADGLTHLLRRPRAGSGLIPVFHPWETGCDDSLRWDDWCAGRFAPDRWRQVKGELVRLLERDEEGAPVGSSGFAVGSVGFNALVAWNIEELNRARPGSIEQDLALIEAIGDRWDPVVRTWIDGPGSGRARTLDALLPLLVDPRSDGFDELAGPFAAPFGPRGAHPDEPSYKPDRYWRGPAWPHLTYLLTRAAASARRVDLAADLHRGLVSGAARSDLSEYWNPDTGEGHGARPQTWAGLALIA